MKTVREIFIIVVTFNIIALIKIHKMRCDEAKKTSISFINCIRFPLRPRRRRRKRTLLSPSLIALINIQPLINHIFLCESFLNLHSLLMSHLLPPSLSLRIITNSILSCWQSFPLFALTLSNVCLSWEWVKKILEKLLIKAFFLLLLLWLITIRYKI